MLRTKSNVGLRNVEILDHLLAVVTSGVRSSETASQSLHVPLSSPQTLEMGASQSQDNKRQAGAAHNNNNLKRNKSIRRHKSVRDDSGYFSVKFKKTQIKIVNADSAELNTIASIIRW